MNLKSVSISGNSRIVRIICLLWLLLLTVILIPDHVSARIYIDINAPSIQKSRIASPDFQDISTDDVNPRLAEDLPSVLANDQENSGYFLPVEKEAFLVQNIYATSPRNIRLKDWSVIGAELLVWGRYTCIGRSLELEVRLFDTFQGKQIMGKRLLGKTREHRKLMHRIGNEIIYLLTGH